MQWLIPNLTSLRNETNNWFYFKTNKTSDNAVEMMKQPSWLSYAEQEKQKKLPKRCDFILLFNKKRNMWGELPFIFLNSKNLSTLMR